MNLTHSFTHAPLRVILFRCLSNTMVKSLERRGIVAPLPSKIYHHSPFDTKIIDPRCLLRIHDLDPRLLPTKNDDRPFECARILPTSCLLRPSDVPSNV